MFTHCPLEPDAQLIDTPLKKIYILQRLSFIVTRINLFIYFGSSDENGSVKERSSALQERYHISHGAIFQ